MMMPVFEKVMITQLHIYFITITFDP